MAIRIPSKNIYSKQNPKVRDNIIERIEVNCKHIQNVVNSNVNVYEGNFRDNDFSKYGSENGIDNTNYEFRQAVTTGYSLYSFAYAGFVNRKIAEISIQIPYLKENSYTNKLYFEKNKTVDETISYSLIGHTESGESSGTWKIKHSSGNTYEPVFGELDYRTLTKSDQQRILILSPITISNTLTVGTTNYVATATAQYIEDKDTITTSKVTQKENGFELTIRIPCDVTAVTLTSKGTKEGGSSYPSLEGDMPVEGRYTKYVIDQIDISLKGDVYTISIEDVVVKYGDDKSKKSNSVYGNELMQTNSYRIDYDEDDNEIITSDITAKMYSKTQELYLQGKETATLLCDVSDYFDFESGKKLIAIDNSTNKMLFKEYDKVFPMVFGADGKDRPMSVKKDGTPKEFTVLGTKIIYDGAVWQELYLQES